MAHPRYSSAEIAERGQSLYEREVQGSLAASDRGKFLVLEIETGEYELDTNEICAEMGLPTEGAVRALLSRAQARLSGLLSRPQES